MTIPECDLSVFRGQECELDDDWNEDVECELDIPGKRDIEFICRVNSNCNVKCSTRTLNRVPKNYRSKVKSILSAGKST
jgi:hypothetical protein